MARTLNATLDGAMDSDTRRPIVSVITSSWADDIPFVGTTFESSTPNEQHPALITHSNGALYCVYREWDEGETAESEGRHLRLRYTDTDRSTWIEADLHSFSDIGGDYFKESALVEMQNGHIGIFLTWNDSGTNKLATMVIDEDANIINALTTIESLGTEYTGGLDVIYNSVSGEYLGVVAFSGESSSNKIKKTTSGDFSSWAPVGELAISGITDNVYNVSLLEISTNDIQMFIDHVDQRDEGGTENLNVYMSTSSDGGGSFSAIDKITDYSLIGESGVHPQVVQKQANQMHLVYTQDSSVLSFGRDMTGWAPSEGPWCSQYNPSEVLYDSVNELLYVVEIYGYAGSEAACGVTVVDTSTWTVDRYYNHLSIPAYLDVFNNVEVSAHIDPPYVVIWTKDINFNVCTVINHQTQTITQYNFESNETWGYDRTMDQIPGDGFHSYYNMGGAQLDANNNRLYILWVDSYYYTHRVMFGYIDLTETADPVTGYYTWNQVSDAWNDYDQGEIYIEHNFKIYPSQDVALFSCPGWSGYNGQISVFQLSSGGRYAKIAYDEADWNNFPFWGVHNCILASNNKIYGGIKYNAGYGDVDKRGIVEIEWVSTKSVSFQRPTYATLDDYYLVGWKDIGDNELLFTSWIQGEGGGVIVYNYSDTSWDIYNRDTIPGFDVNDQTNAIDCADYDSDTGTIYAAVPYYPPSVGNSRGIVFSRFGIFKQPYYMVGTYTTQWDWSEPSQFIYGLYNGQTDISIDEDNSIWAIWRAGATDSGYALKWGREGAILELADFVPQDTEVGVEWSLDAPAVLTFSLAKAWLFDPSNLLSIYSPMLRKGRKITLKFGEKVWESGAWVEYWENQGQYIVTESALTYERGTDPIMNVTCTDRRWLWTEMHVMATDYYEHYPRTVLLDLLSEWADLTEAQTDIDDPLDSAHDHEIYTQWIDTPFNEIVDEILHHFGHVGYFDMDGKFSTIKVTDEGSITNTYSDNTQIMKYTPDDSYSSFVNRVEVQGESHDWYDMTYPEERILQDHGTIGYWAENNTKRYYYSEDRARRCVSPRLANVQDPKGQIFFLNIGGGNIGIEDWDDEDYWIEIMISNPNAVPTLVFLLVALAETALACTPCDTWKYCGACMQVITLEIIGILEILAGSAHWSFDLYAQPLGQEKQSIQGVAEDEDFQRELGGIVVVEKIDDPLCYTVADCTTVAEQELMIVQKQRSRVSFSKLAHLQDELGDTIRIVHPYTSANVDVYITNLKRRYRMGVGKESGFFDDIEGWRV